MDRKSYNKRRAVCAECSVPFVLPPKYSVIPLHCRVCTEGTVENVGEIRNIKSQHAIAEACKAFVRETKNQIKKGEESQQLPIIMNAFIAKLGGSEALSERLVHDFRRERGEFVPEEEKAFFEQKSQVVQRYYDMILKLLEKQDARKNTDLSNVSEEDLMATLMGSVLEMIRSDPQFRREVALEALREEPDIINEYLSSLPDVGVMQEPRQS